jgi:hypothetical protein
VAHLHQYRSRQLTDLSPALALRKVVLGHSGTVFDTPHAACLCFTGIEMTPQSTQVLMMSVGRSWLEIEYDTFRLYRWPSSGLLCHVVCCLYTNVSEEHTASIVRASSMCATCIARSQSSWFDHPHNIWWRVQTMEVLTVKLPTLQSLHPSSVRIPPLALWPQIPWIFSPHMARVQVLHIHINNRQDYSFVFFIITSLDNRPENKVSCTEWQRSFPKFNMPLIISACHFDFLPPTPNRPIWTLPHFRRIY